MNIDAKDIIHALAIKYEGEWKDMYDTILKRKRLSSEEVSNLSQQCTTSYITITDTRYPKPLKEVYQPPFILYYYGNIELLDENKLLTAVGTREPSQYQKRMMEELIGKTIDHYKGRITILSGMALGLDSIAMREAMKREAPVIAVLGSGIDNPYPLENSDIYDYCRKGNGLVLSEYPLFAEPKSQHFTFRNRIIAALSRVCFIGGGKNRSGTSSTARHALELGKEVLALPCDVTGDDLTNTLIQDGARPVLSYIDIVDALEENS